MLLTSFGTSCVLPGLNTLCLFLTISCQYIFINFRKCLNLIKFAWGNVNHSFIIGVKDKTIYIVKYFIKKLYLTSHLAQPMSIHFTF